MKERDGVLKWRKSEEAGPSWRASGDSPVKVTLVLRPKGRGKHVCQGLRGRVCLEEPRESHSTRNPVREGETEHYGVGRGHTCRLL